MLLGKEKLYFTASESEAEYLKKRNFSCSETNSPYNKGKIKSRIYIFKGTFDLYNALYEYYADKEAPTRLESVFKAVQKQNRGAL